MDDATPVGIIGAGTMGTGIAQVAATAGHDVRLFDVHAPALDKARDHLNRILGRLVEKERLTGAEAEAIFGRIHFASDLSAMAGCGLVIEAIIEDLDIKKDLVRQLEKHISEDCVLATNTSSLSVTSIAGASAVPQRVIGIHFFNPAPLMKLVEIIPAVQTASRVTMDVTGLIDSWGKITVHARDTPGFIVNRIARPFYSESIRILEEGLADTATIDWAMTEVAGFRMGPFALMDYIGNDVNYAVTESVWKACYFEPRYQPSFTQKRLVEAGYLGRKSGRGYYLYDESPSPEPNKDKTLGDQIAERVVTMLINEAADALYWNIASAEDIETAMTKGVNYPKGLLAWADEWGIDRVMKTMDRCFDHYRDQRYRCSPQLRQMAAENASFL